MVFPPNGLQIEAFEMKALWDSQESTVPQSVGIYNPPITAHEYIQLSG